MLKKTARTFECAKLILKSTDTFILVNKVGEKVRALRIAMNYPLLRIVETMRWRHNGRRCQCLFFDFFDSKVRRQLKSFEMFNRIFQVLNLIDLALSDVLLEPFLSILNNSECVFKGKCRRVSFWHLVKREYLEVICCISQSYRFYTSPQIIGICNG